MPIIEVSAVCFVRDALVLTVRKRGTDAFMLPGGKPEAGETAFECAIREIHEELNVKLDPALVHPFGTWEAAAANEDGHTVRATVFRYGGDVSPEISAEIVEMRWIDARDGLTDSREAPLNREAIFPALLATDSDRERL